MAKTRPAESRLGPPFNDHSEFIRAIDTAANMDQEEYNEWCDSSQRYIYQLIERNPYKDDFCHMFQPEA
ncbi:hypothetical protein ACQ86N_08975 [Puia sp. P3]|uniref:hypothetical protein n=1 Tax=Puia sp. P3 TaxID=3423952 RepID=UPI003D66AC0F